jgi:hypothetical protein
MKEWIKSIRDSGYIDVPFICHCGRPRVLDTRQASVSIKFFQAYITTLKNVFRLDVLDDLALGGL